MSGFKKHLHHENGFTIIDNSIFRKKELDLRAIGLLIQLLSLPDNWKFSIKGLVKICKDGESSVTTGLNQLKEYGYLTVERERINGRLGDAIYHIYDDPEDNENFQAELKARKLEEDKEITEIKADSTIDEIKDNSTIIENEANIDIKEEIEGHLLQTVENTEFLPERRFAFQVNLSQKENNQPKSQNPDMGNHDMENHNQEKHNLVSVQQYSIYNKENNNKEFIYKRNKEKTEGSDEPEDFDYHKTLKKINISNEVISLWEMTFPKKLISDCVYYASQNPEFLDYDWIYSALINGFQPERRHGYEQADA